MRPVLLSERIFAVALLLLPRWFRDQYGEDMKRDFVERSRVIGSKSGWAARVAFQIRSVLAVPGQALRVRRQSPKTTRGTMKMTGLWNDARFALRGLLRAPGFTAITIGTLALGIGATTAIFTVVNGVLLRPLPFED